MTDHSGQTPSPQEPSPPRVKELTREPLMTQTKVAELFRVSSITITRWIRQGALTPFRTLGGHKRFRATEVLALAGLPRPTAEPEPPPPTA